MTQHQQYFKGRRGYKLDTKIRDATIWAERALGHSISAIAARNNLSEQTVRSSLSRVADKYQVEAAAELIKLELDRLDILLLKAMEVLNAEHLAYNHGRLMVDADGNNLVDHEPVMKAMDRVLKIMDRRSKYLGLDAPTKSEQSISVYKQDEMDLQIQDLLNSAKASAALLTPEALDIHNTPATPTPNADN